MSAPKQDDLDALVATKRRVLRRWAFRLWVVGARESSLHAIVRVEDGVLVAACGHPVREPQWGRNSLHAPTHSGITGCQACHDALGLMAVEQSAGGRHRLEEQEWPTFDRDAHTDPWLDVEAPVDDPGSRNLPGPATGGREPTPVAA
jgi:hypothetical protein